MVFHVIHNICVNVKKYSFINNIINNIIRETALLKFSFYILMKDNSTRIEPSINWKCLVFTVVIAGGYWFLPQKNKWILAILLYLSLIHI